MSEVKIVEIILLVVMIEHFKGLKVDFVPQDAPDPTKPFAKLRTFLRLVGDDLQSCTCREQNIAS